MEPPKMQVKSGFILLTRLASFVLCLLLSNYWVKADPPPGSGNWVQTFNEDFKGITMASDKRSFTTNDGNTWITTFFWGNGSIGDGSLNYYTGNNVSCDGENLVMKVSQELAAGQHPFAGGLANTDPTSGGSFSQTFGYYELRVKISMTDGDAPYAGLPPVNHAWPPETEMFETPYAWGQNGQKIHFLNKTSTCDGPAEYDFGSGFHLQDAYHTIGLLWDQNQVIFYVDGVQRGVGPCTPDQNPVFLNIGHGCGSDGGVWNGDAYLGTWPQNVYYDYFKVWSKDGSGTKTFVTPAAPTAISGDGKIALSWLGSVDATSYNVKRSTSSGSGYSTIATVTTPYYTDNNVSNGSTYYYVVTAVKSGSETGNSKEASAVPVEGTGTNGSKLCGYGTVCGEGFSGSSDGYRAFDGNMNSYFDYITPNGAQTGIDIGAGNSASLTRVKFYPRGGFEGRMTGGKFQGSNDNVNFTDLYTISSDPAAGWNEVTVNAGTSYRYFRYLSPADSYGNVLEIEFYGNVGSVSVSVTGVSVSQTTASIGVGATQTLTATVVPSNATNKSVTWSSSNTAVATVSSTGLVTGLAAGSVTITVTTVDGAKTATCFVTVTSTSSNLALNKVTTVSSTENSSLAGSYTVDGNASTRWSSAFSDPQWIYVDLGATYSINQVRLNWEGAAGKDYKIQVSSDASTWTDIKTVTGNTTAGVKDYTGLSGSGRYVRMYGSARATAYGYSLYEIEVYGTSESWTKIDDADASVVYSAGWSTWTGNGGYQNTEHYTFGSGNSATLTFTGTKARFYGFKRNDLGLADIYIDGTKVASFDCYNSTMLVNQMLYETATLTSGQHTIAIKCTATKNASSSGTQMIVDAFEYASSTLKSAISVTGVTGVANATNSVLNVMVFPNPITAESVLKIIAPEASDVSIRIVDISGRVIFANQLKVMGEMSIPLNLEDIVKGVYILYIKQGNQIITKQIVK